MSYQRFDPEIWLESAAERAERQLWRPGAKRRGSDEKDHAPPPIQDGAPTIAEVMLSTAR
jgi:hypothetical protein